MNKSIIEYIRKGVRRALSIKENRKNELKRMERKVRLRVRK